jgi:hypothetical protein
MHRLVTVAALALGLFLAAPASAANFTSSHITTPANETLQIYNVNVTNTLHVEGTTSGGDSNADLVCFYGATLKRVLATNVTVTAGAFSVDVPDSGFATLTQPNPKPYCVLRAVPTGDVTAYPPTGPNNFDGPRILTGRIQTFTVDVASGPNKDVVNDYFAGVGQRKGYMDLFSFGGCGVDWSFLFDPITLEPSNALFYCNGWTWAKNGCDAASPTCTVATRSEIMVDGNNAYAPPAAERLYEVDATHSSKLLSGFPALTFTRSIDPLNGNVHVDETSPIVKCSPNGGAFHLAGNDAMWNTDCTSFASAGVSVNRTVDVDQDGRRTRFVDVWSNTDSVSHDVDALYDEEFSGDGGTNPSPSFAYSWLDPNSFAAPDLDQTVNGPNDSSPATVFIDGNAGSADAFAFPQAAVTVSPAPTSVRWYTKTGSRYYGLFRFAATIPPGGTAKVLRTYIQSDSKGDVATQAAAERDRFGSPVVAITSPANGSTTDNPAATVTGTASDPGAGAPSLKVNGEDVTVAGDGTWSKALTLAAGENTITATATDGAGNSTTATSKVTFTPKVVLPVPDKLAPTIALAIAKTKLKALLAKGLPVTVSCSEACKFVLSLVVDSKTAKKLHLSRVATVGRASGTLTTAGKKKVVVKLTKKAKKKVAKAKKIVITVKTTATDAAGNRGTKSKKVTIKR